MSEHDDLIKRVQPYYNDLPVEGMKVLDELVNALTEARKALEPFAQLADFAHNDHRDSRPIIFGMDTVLSQRLTIGHLRAAKAALSGEEGKSE